MKKQEYHNTKNGTTIRRSIGASMLHLPFFFSTSSCFILHIFPAICGLRIRNKVNAHLLEFLFYLIILVTVVIISINIRQQKIFFFLPSTFNVLFAFPNQKKFPFFFFLWAMLSKIPLFVHCYLQYIAKKRKPH